MASGSAGTCAVPSSPAGRSIISRDRPPIPTGYTHHSRAAGSGRSSSVPVTAARRGKRPARSEEHTSELQSHLNLVCRLLLEKKKKKKKKINLQKKKKKNKKKRKKQKTQ